MHTGFVTTVDVARYLREWKLEPDGDVVETASSVLAPVRYRGTAAMLKVSTVEEEAAGGRLMVWWAGRGAARIFEHDGDAILLQRATGMRSLAAMARSGDDADAAGMRILCAAAGRLHGIAGEWPAGLTPLTVWFRELLNGPTAAGLVTADPFLDRARVIARELLSAQIEQVVLHGDLHHENVLDFAGGESGDEWRAIDPKALVGDRAFDYANLLCNPDAASALAPGRLDRRVRVITETAGIERERMLRWSIAWSALSSLWRIHDGADPGHTLEVGRASERLL